MPEWEDVEVPRGAYISWGLKVGQHVTGKVIEYSVSGGTDFNGDSCPSIAIELTESAVSVNKAGDRTNHDAGELVQLNAGQVSLKRALRAADPSPGDLVKISLDNILVGKGQKGGDVKEFGIKIARGAAVSSRKPPMKQDIDDEPPW
jgi:hypothetical protein